MWLLPNAIHTTPVYLPSAEEKGVKLYVARLDLIHPVVSGNKLFKLIHNITAALHMGKKGIITMGGAYSNHLVATAYACKKSGLASIGIVRGEIDDTHNLTLHNCSAYGMKLMPVARAAYRRQSDEIKKICEENADYLFVPEGGDNALGEKGCTEMLPRIAHWTKYTHIACAMGTGTTFRGVAASALASQTVVGIPVIKINMPQQRKAFMAQNIHAENACTQEIHFDFARRGYGKGDETLFRFMNEFYGYNAVPTDFVYTGKLMMAVDSLIQSGHFPPSAEILLLHTGGLQGNRSLPQGGLQF